MFKSPTATHVEGAIAMQIDLQKGRVAINLRGSYNDIADAKTFSYIGSISHVGQFADDTLGIALGYSGRRQGRATVRTNIFRPTNSFADLNADGQGNDRIPFGNTLTDPTLVDGFVTGITAANPGGVPTCAFNRDRTDPSVNRVSEFQIPTTDGGAPIHQ